MTIFQSCQQKDLLEIIEQTQEALLFVSPGVTQKLANAIVRTSNRLGNNKVWVMIDSNSKIIRQGYGTIEGLTTLHKTNVLVNNVSTLRFGFIRSDKIALVFMPISELLEDAESPINSRYQNLLFSEFEVDEDKPNTFINGLFLSPEEADRITIGLLPEAAKAFNSEIKLPSLILPKIADGLLTSNDIEKVELDIQKNPPVSPVLGRKVRIINSRFQFVEIEFKGSKLSHRKFSLSAIDMGIDSEQAHNNLSGVWKIVDSEIDKETDSLEKRLKEIKRKYLKSLPGFGSIIFNQDRQNFDEEIKNLKKAVEDNLKNLESKVESLLNESKNRLRTLMISSYEKNPPPALRNLELPTEIRKKQIENYVEDLLQKKYPQTKAILSKVELDCKIFNISEQIITKDGFAQAIRKAFSVDLEDLVKSEEAVQLDSTDPR